MDYVLYALRCSLIGICHITGSSRVSFSRKTSATMTSFNHDPGKRRRTTDAEEEVADYSQIIPKLCVSTAGYGKQMELGRG